MATSLSQPITLTANDKKRTHEETESSPEKNETDNNNRTITSSNWPRYLITESTDLSNSLSNLSPFVVEKAMKGIGEAKSVKKLRSGVLLIEATKEAQA